MHQRQKFGENLSIDTGDIVETWKSWMHSVMPWPWTLTFWPQNLISSSLSRDAAVTKVWRKSVNRYWRYRGNIKLPRESRADGRTHARTDGRPENIASAGGGLKKRSKWPGVSDVPRPHGRHKIWRYHLTECSEVVAVSALHRKALHICTHRKVPFSTNTSTHTTLNTDTTVTSRQ